MKDIPIEQILSELGRKHIRIMLEDETRLHVSAPKGALTKEQKEELGRRKPEIIAFLRNSETRKQSEAPPLVAVPRNGKLPLSFNQQRMWFLHQMNPQDCSYNLQTIAIISANRAHVKEAINEILHRHEILRTNYRMVDGEPVQVIHAPESSDVKIDEYVSTGTDINTSWRQLKKNAESNLGLPFDLTSGPVWRVQIHALHEDISAVVITIHHIASDGWSLKNLVSEMRRICEAKRLGETANLNRLPLQYADYAVWQRKYLQGYTLDRSLAYWRDRLEGVPAVIELPTDYRRPEVQTSNGAAFAFDLSDGDLAGLQHVAKKNHATLFMVLLAIFKILLYRYTRQNDIVVGTPVAGREHSGVEDIQGLFVNNLVLRTRMSDDLGFAEILQLVKKTTLGAYSHGDLPFEKLVETIHPRRSLSYNPLFQVVFNQLILSSTSEEYHKLGIEQDARSLSEMKAYAQQDIGLSVQQKPDMTTLVFSYNTDLFRRSTIERMASHYLKLIDSVLKHQKLPISDLTMLSGSETETQLVQWNQTAHAFSDKPVSRLMEVRAAENPDATALVFNESQLSYAGLNAESNRLARHLLDKNIGSGKKVGLFFDRGLEMFIAIFGVLKAGAAYLPLDPSYPSDRIAFMLNDSQAQIIITNEQLLDRLPKCEAQVMVLDKDADAIRLHSVDNLPDAPAMSDLAYVIYTSGSTGVPKGVEVPHAALSNLLQAMMLTPGMRKDDVMVAITTISFDMAVPELYLPLIAGARIVIAEENITKDGVALGKLIDSCGATVLQATPSTWRMLFASGWKGKDKLKAICGAEPMPHDLVDHLLENCSSVWNMYGPTETTVWSMFYEITRESPRPLIGRPLANTSIYVLDHNLHPVPIGVIGEVYIGGKGVTRGYWQRAELTAERYLPDPFCSSPGRKMYKTGDLARFHEGGYIEYIGRADHQVKLRGFRIELGEIEAALARQKIVNTAVAAIREDVSGDQRLVAYVTLHSNDEETGKVQEQLRTSLSDFLPSYMVPSIFVFLDELPLTVTGKVDRKLLPEIEIRRRNNDGYIAPRTELEKTLAGIWCEVIGIDKVSADDNFFDIGGHSLIAIKSIVEFRDKTGKTLQPVDYYQQTLAQLAAGAEGGITEQRAPAQHSQIRLEPAFFGDRDRYLFGLTRLVENPRNTGVVLCHPHAHEYNRSHRAMRELGLRLAKNGFNVFSFDYYGTGDSAGEYQDATYDEWMENVSRAIEYFKNSGQVSRVCLVGMRLGATLAYTIASGRMDVQAVALWDPVLTASDILQDMRTISDYQNKEQEEKQDLERTDVLAYPITQKMLTEIENIDMFSVNEGTFSHILVLENAADANGRETAGLLAKEMTETTYLNLDEPRVWMREQYESIVPQKSINALVGWIDGVCK